METLPESPPSGKSAEWIIERTTVDDELPLLPNYGTVTFEGIFAYYDYYPAGEFKGGTLLTLPSQKIDMRDCAGNIEMTRTGAPIYVSDSVNSFQSQWIN
ncbi:G1 family glutamic endopeptidase [Spirillospora sp. CA-255316]